MNDAETVAKGHRASIELRETEDAFNQLRGKILEEIVKTSPSQPDKVLKLHLSVQNLEAVRKALLLMVQNGEYAEQALAQAGLTRA